jgi:hypothetical protein
MKSKITRYQLTLYLFSLVFQTCAEIEPGENGDSDPVDAGADGSPDLSDRDGDGYTVEQGDCDDWRALINPGAIEDLGDGGAGDEVDNDCDGQTDELELCDTSLVGTSAHDIARAMNLCDGRFFLGAKKVFSSPQGENGFDTVASQGQNDCIVARQGTEMAAIGTGPIGQPNPNYAVPMGGVADLALDPMPAYQSDAKQTGKVEKCCDVTQIELSLRSPSNARGVSFEFLFGSAEFDEWIERGYNDTFYAILVLGSLNGGATTNIAFDDKSHEIEVDTNFFENKIHLCDETGSGWELLVEEKSGSTGWLKTTWEIPPNEPFTLTFSIHDEGDCKFDSITFIDNFTWQTKPVKNETIIVE